MSVCPASSKLRVQAQARELAESLGLELVADPSQAADMLLVVTAGGLELRDPAQKGVGPVKAQFGHAAKLQLRYGNQIFREPFGKAIALRPWKSGSVWDVTAGLGNDTWRLACMGLEVVAIERSPILATMLRDGLDRAARDAELGSTAQSIRVIEGDAREVLDAVPREESPDVVYMDPMFAPRKKKSAAAKKEMRVLRRLVGDDPDAGELLEAAMRTARRRVVVKRLRHAGALRPKPDVSYRGKIARYDAYFTWNVVTGERGGYGDDDEDWPFREVIDEAQ